MNVLIWQKYPRMVQRRGGFLVAIGLGDENVILMNALT
jgi:hypothetical protein